MKKDFIFAPILLVISLVLGFLTVTGLTAHIIVSVVGIVALAAYTALTIKEWKVPALEIGTRASYGLALITGIVIKIKYIVAAAIAHKVFATLFLVLLIATFVQKLIATKKAEK